MSLPGNSNFRSVDYIDLNRRSVEPIGSVDYIDLNRRSAEPIGSVDYIDL